MSLISLVRTAGGRLAARLDALRVADASASFPYLKYDATEDALIPSATGGGLENDFTRALTISTVAKDYTLDAAYNPSADYPDSDHGAVTVSGRLGNGTDEPYFYAFGRNLIAANGLTRTTNGRIRIQWIDAGSSMAAIWPAAVNGAGIWIPLPSCIDLSVTFSVWTSAPGEGASNPVAFGVTHSVPGQALPIVLANVDWLSGAANALDQTPQAMGTAETPSGINGYVSSGIGSRRHRIEIHGPNAAIYGGAVGATGPSDVATTRLAGRSNMTRANKSDMGLYLVIGQDAGTPYAEIGNITMTVKRALF